MNQTHVTVVGNVATDPRLREVANGSKVLSFRLAVNDRRFDKALKQWRDANTVFFTVTCWRALAENVFSSVSKGQPVIVHGKLSMSTYDDRDGVTRTVIDVDAAAVGHDLSRGVSAFTKADPSAATERELAAELARELDEEEMPAFDRATGELVDLDESRSAFARSSERVTSSTGGAA